MEKTYLVKQDKQYYSSKTKPEIREFQELNYLTIIGKGEPAGVEFTKAIESLYPLAYGVKKIYKLKEMDFAIPKLEGLWWFESDLPGLEVPRSEVINKNARLRKIQDVEGRIRLNLIH